MKMDRILLIASQMNEYIAKKETKIARFARCKAICGDIKGDLVQLSLNIIVPL